MALQTEKNYIQKNSAFHRRCRQVLFRNYLPIADADAAVFCSLEGEGSIADEIDLRHSF